MKSNGKHPAVNQAVDYIRKNLAARVWLPGQRLPPSLVMAHAAGVSPVTMLKAIDILRSEGRISGVRRGAIRVKSADSELPVADGTHMLAWRVRRMQLERDILAGAFDREGYLPSFKALEARYGACFRTTQKILRAMVADNILQMRGKRFALAATAKRQPGDRIVFITNQTLTPPVSALNRGQHRVRELLEQECLRRQVQPAFVEIDFYNQAEIRQALSKPAINAPAAGYVLDLYWFSGAGFRRSYIDLMTRLLTLRKPVAILDETNEFQLPVQFAASPLFQVFRIEGTKAGARMARNLMGLGHRSVAFVSSHHGQVYSRQRQQGVDEHFLQAGCGEVVPIVTGKMEQQLEHLLVISGFDDRLVRKIMSVDRTKSQADDTFAQFKEVQKTRGPSPLGSEEVDILRRNLSGIVDLTRSDMDAVFFNKMCQAFLREAGELMSAMLLRPLFERALAHQSVSAWVCATDGIALAALDFLRRRRIAVPGAISVTGFDNQAPEALENALTTFDFNPTGFVHAMLNFIARPARPRGAYRHEPIEVEGTVMVRGTSGPTRRAGPGPLQSAGPI